MSLLTTYNADAFGQLVTQNAIENIIKNIGNTEKLKYSTWSSGKEQADALCTEAEIPFVSPNVISSRGLSEIRSASLIQEYLQYG